MADISIDENGIKVDGITKYSFTDSYIIFEKADIDKVAFVKTAPAEIKILGGTKVRVGSADILIADDTTISLNSDLDNGDKVAGTDYYVYVKADATLYISADKTITDDRLVGGFHYSLVAEDEAPNGNKTEDDMVNLRGINKYSLWDLKFRASAGNEGMALIGTKWYDIYLLNGNHIVNGTSKAGANIAGGATDYGREIPKIPLFYGGDGDTDYGKLTWFQLCEIAKSHGKEMIDYAEFTTIAYGVDEGKSSDTDDYEVDTGKIEHYSHLLSIYGIEQASGVQYVWGKDLSKREDGDGSWKDNLDGRGQIYSYGDNSQVAVRLGGHRGDGVDAGSRCSSWDLYVWYSAWNIGSRFCCDHLKLV